jgi:hypothetical protein
MCLLSVSRSWLPLFNTNSHLSLDTVGYIKGKFHSRTGQEDPQGEQLYSSTLFLTSVLDGGRCSTPRPVVLPPWLTRWSQAPVWMGEKTLTPTRIRSPDRPACSESLYHLRYPGPYIFNYLFKYSSSSFRILYHNYHNNHLKTSRIHGDLPCTPNLLRLLLILVDELKIFCVSSVNLKTLVYFKVGHPRFISN